MKYLKLDPEEKQILKDYNNDEFVQVKNFAQEKKRYQKIAQATLSKKRNINIRLSEKDIHKLKSKAIEKGIPYQTLVSTLVHQYASGKIKLVL